MAPRRPPSFSAERELIAQGFRAIVGVDEAGCGALAGPLVAGAVILPLDSRLGLLRDSKLLSPQQRDGLYDVLIERCVAWAVGSASVEEILELGIRQSNLLAMRRAVEKIPQADFVLVDAWKIPGISQPQRGIIRGDLTVKSIAAGSIVAKVTRDRIMIEYASQYPGYGFEIHKGYATAAHKQAISERGPCPIHRTGWKPFQSPVNV